MKIKTPREKERESIEEPINEIERDEREIENLFMKLKLNPHLIANWILEIDEI